MDSYIYKPRVMVFAGPNGSGKTTVTRSIPIVGTYVNADDMKKTYDLTDIEAAKLAESLRNKLLNGGMSFSFETVMSTERNLKLIKKAKERGYEVKCIYVLTCNENINVARVKARYAAGGHDVPEDKIRLRYHRALKLLPRVMEVCDEILIYDNTVMPSLLASKDNDVLEIFPNIFWSESDLRALLEA